jgi:starvation-inducible DNA-binding protein
MLGELREGEKGLVVKMLQVHGLCDASGDGATASLPKNWIDQAQRRICFLFETLGA